MSTHLRLIKSDQELHRETCVRALELSYLNSLYTPIYMALAWHYLAMMMIMGVGDE